MPMRRETLKALEQRRDHVVSERKQSKMLTLGASNNMNNNKDKHRSAAKITGDTVDKIFAVAHSGVDNIAFGKFLLCVHCFVFLFAGRDNYNAMLYNDFINGTFYQFHFLS